MLIRSGKWDVNGFVEIFARDQRRPNSQCTAHRFERIVIGLENAVREMRDAIATAEVSTIGVSGWIKQ
jgi:hypothetical protein